MELRMLLTLAQTLLRAIVYVDTNNVLYAGCPNNLHVGGKKLVVCTKGRYLVVKTIADARRALTSLCFDMLRAGL